MRRLPTLRAIVFLRISILGVLLTLLAPQAAFAEWDAKTFVKLRDAAQKQYDDGDYEGALPRYRVLESMIDDALAAKEIPKKQKKSARDALDIARYQIGRCLQLTNECGEAVEAYVSLVETSESDDISLKGHARLTESRACHASALLDGGQIRGAADALALLETQLETRPDTAAASEAVSTMVDEAWKNGGGLVAQLRKDIVTASLGAGSEAAKAGKCDDARTEEAFVASFEPSASGELAVLSDEIAQECTVAPAVVAADTSSAAPPVGAIVLMSIGAATLVGDAVYEFAFVNPKLEELDDADGACRATGTQCDDVLSLKDELEIDRIISISLLGGGGALLLGGVIWWVVDASSDDTETFDTNAFFVPQQDGAVIGIRWTH